MLGGVHRDVGRRGRCTAELDAASAHPEAEADRACIGGCERGATCTSERFGETITLDCACQVACLAARSPEYQRLAMAASSCWYDGDVRAACF